MKKTYSESELKELAQKAINNFSGTKEIFTTEDGQCFLVKNRAELHAGPKGKVYTFESAKAEKSQEETPISAKDVIAQIQATETIKELELFKTDSRKSVVDAFNKKLKAFGNATFEAAKLKDVVGAVLETGKAIVAGVTENNENDKQ